MEATADAPYGRPVWFGTDAYVRVDTGSDGANTLVALDRDDGTVRWRRSAGYEIEGVTPAPEAVYVASSVNDPDGGILVRVDRFAPDGARQWQVTTELQIGGTLHAMGRLGGIVFVASDNAVHALDPADGSRRWRYEPDRGLSAATHCDALYVSSRNAGGVARLPTG
jgi:outer membrane protein assembly factor BamB